MSAFGKIGEKAMKTVQNIHEHEKSNFGNSVDPVKIQESEGTEYIYLSPRSRPR